jgi:integral membrane sensor domain MASE1
VAAILVGAFLVNVTTAGNFATSFGIATGNTLEAVCGAWLVNRFAGGRSVFDRRKAFSNSHSQQPLAPLSVPLLV